MKVKRLMAPRPFPLTLIGFPPGRARILRARSERVCTTMPSATGVAQAGKGFGAFSTSTRHMRQLAAIESLLW